MDAEAEAFALSDYFAKIVAEYKKIRRRTSMCPDNGYLRAEEERLYGRILEFKSKYRPFIKERKNSLGRFDVERYLEFCRMSSRAQIFSMPETRLCGGPVIHGRGCTCCEPWMQHPGGYQSHGTGMLCSGRDFYDGHIKRLCTPPDVCTAPTLLTSTEEACRTITLSRRQTPFQKRVPEGVVRESHSGGRRRQNNNAMQIGPGVHMVEKTRENIDYLNKMVIRDFYERNDYIKPLAMFLRHSKLANLRSNREPFESFGLGAEHTHMDLDCCDIDEMYRRCDVFLNEVMHLACSTAFSRDDRTLMPGDFSLVLSTAYDMIVPETLLLESDADSRPVRGGT